MNTIYCAMFLKPNAVVKGIKSNFIRHKYEVEKKKKTYDTKLII